ncbi:hypothetical protein PMIN02_003283 [Paraphaeosphaeria minitans]|uniref:NAD(P)-binding protein n=1 Tax=Paraphaeosphaeria minitans TaxID=565426 RepID=A0A9P6KNE2_9PLEO|nr:hypothetical protein PMIN01_09514 [Paraphaeosphaeria minitans]
MNRNWSVAKELKGNTLVAAGDITNEENVKAIFEKAIARFGTVDVVLNAAGIFNYGTIGDMGPSQWWAEHVSLFEGLLHMQTASPPSLFMMICRQLARRKLMLKQPTSLPTISTAFNKDRTTTFINLVSLGASMTNPGLSSLSTSQLAATKLGKHLDLELSNVRVFSVHPGIVEAKSGRGAVVDAMTPFAKDQPELTGAFTLYLLKPEADVLRGGYASVNWDVEEIEKHGDEIKEKRLLRLHQRKGRA